MEKDKTERKVLRMGAQGELGAHRGSSTQGVRPDLQVTGKR